MLSETAAKLQDQFAALHAARKDSGHPVYALEHGLEKDELTEVRGQLTADLTQSRTLRREHWLLWLAVAAEVGYDYDGNEYWISFAQQIRHWSWYGSRDQIRTWFRRFESEFGGYRPEGRWAEHFSIIAWPIAHAILPKDLQHQFARHLNELKYELARAAHLSSSEIGDLLHSHDSGGSSRFRNLLQHGELTSRLLLAMRDEDVDDASSTIYRPTLARIVNDLEQNRVARAWLRDARSVLREARFQPRGGLQDNSRPHTPAAIDAIKRTKSVKLLARRSAAGSWALGIWLPDLNAMLAGAGLGLDSLARTRVRFADRADAWMPGRAIAALSQTDQPVRHLLQISEGPVLVLEQSLSPVSEIFNSELQVLGQSPWLLKVQADGTARHIAGNHVRASEKYVLVSTARMEGAVASSLALEELACPDEGAFLYSLATPAQLTPTSVADLAKLGLGCALRATVEPVGLLPRNDGTAEGTIWLATEEILLRLIADTPVAEYLIRIDGGDQTRILAGDDAQVVISLGPLPIGSHTLEVGAFSVGQKHPTTTNEFEPVVLSLEVRSPQPWRQGMAERAGIRLFADSGATLQDVLDGSAQVLLVGPAERQITVELRTFTLNGHRAKTAELGKVTLPVEPNALQQVLRRAGQDRFEEVVHSSPRIDFAFVASEMGEVCLTVTQKVHPLRWVLEVTDKTPSIRLVDEAGISGVIDIVHSPLGVPDGGSPVELDKCLEGLSVEAPGALVAASYGGEQYGAVVSIAAAKRMSSFSELGLKVGLATPPSGTDAVPALVERLRLWSSAQLLGSLAATRRASLLLELRRGIAQAVCGRTWTDLAYQCRSGRADLLGRLKKDIQGGTATGFSSRMHSDDWCHLAGLEQQQAEFFKHVQTYRLCDDRSVCDLAVTLAFAPALATFDQPDTLAALSEFQAIARGAFFAQLVTDLTERGALAKGAVA